MKIKDRQQLLIILAATVVGLFLGDKLLFTPLVGWWKTRSEEIGKLRNDVADGIKLTKRAAAITNRWDNMRTNTLPYDTAAAEQQILQAFDMWSQFSRVSVTAISPQWKRDTDDYMSLECRVDAFGSMNAITRFLYEIESDPLALKIEAIELSARDNEGQQLALGLQISGLALNPKAQ